MNKAVLGVILALAFVFLESTQFVYFGGLFQRMSSFLFGLLVFGTTIIFFVGWAAIRSPEQLRAAIRNPRPLIGVNLTCVLALTSYLLSVQLVEPAITYTISSGVMPITTYILYRFGVPEGEPMRNPMEAAGNLLLFAGILFLFAITLLGFSGFVRGDVGTAIAGILLAIADGVFFTFVLVFSRRLNNVGVAPGTVLGLRVPLYVLLAGSCTYLGIDAKAPMTTSDITLFVLIGFILTVPPLYMLQKAVSMISTLTIGTLTALGPFVIFALQLVEGRVDYAPLTLAGLAIYFAGSIAASIGAVRATTKGADG